MRKSVSYKSVLRPLFVLVYIVCFAWAVFFNAGQPVVDLLKAGLIPVSAWFFGRTIEKVWGSER